LERVVALRLHLDPCTEDNGPLRVIEGSHLAGLLSDAEVLRYANERPQQTCVVECGGVLAMRPLLIHASSKATSADPRRVLHIEYADALELAPGIRLAVA
jgi:ectoine hydroxylase-related dioxygenase (phytanoyl-CoA dioxygenase family)